MIGQTIAHYKLVDKLGEGGMGIVYLAEDLHLDRLVAVKLLPPERVADEERRKRFVQEAKAASALNHSNIITIYDIATADGLSYMAMEYVRGKTLLDVLAQGRPTIREALHYSVQIADALALAHDAGIIHRDLKPANIMVTPSGVVKVLDFGLAKLVAGLDAIDDRATHSGAVMPMTQEGIVLGTLAYMSPEQAEGRPLTRHADIFSFGCMLYELLTGQRPFSAGSGAATLAAILVKDVVSPRDLNASIPEAIDALVLRCLQKDPAKRPQHMNEVRLALANALEESHPSRVSTAIAADKSPRGARVPRWMFAAAVTGVLAVAALAFWISTNMRPEPPPASRILTRLTSDAGLSAYPALSLDGEQLVYASDRGNESNLDLWIRPTGGGEPTRLTDHAADDYEPSVSPDGKTIVFRSERDGGGVYLVAASGGQAKLIAPEGRRPRFSPDGQWVAYWTGGQGGAGVGERIFLVDAAGGAPKPWQPPVSTASYPVWSPDGKHILFLGKQKAASRWPETADWWVAPVDGSSVTPTGAIDVLGRTAFLNFVAPELWTPDTDAIVYSAKVGDGVNLWRVPISRRSWKVGDPPRQLTSGTGLEVHPSMARNGRLVFSSLIQNDDVWQLRLDQEAPSALSRLTENSSSDTMPSISDDGNRIAFLSNRLGHYQVWSRDLSTNRETALTGTPGGKMFPVISHDGSKIAFSTEGGKEIHVARTSGEPPTKVCDDCGLPRTWTRDGNRVLYQWGEPRRFGLVDVRTGARQDVLQHPTFGIYSGRLSPDERWIAFQVRVWADRTRIFIAPFRVAPAAPVADREWIPVAEGPENDKPRWSLDGDRLYFTSFRDGFRCIWSQQLDATTKRPVGEVQAVYHFHQTRRSMVNVPMYYRELAVARETMVFELGELVGNIWGFTVEGGR